MKTLLLSVFISTIGILFFTWGFLLVRFEVDKYSEPCTKSMLPDTVQEDPLCLTLKSPKYKYDKVIILIIDALRYDFAAFQNEDSKFNNFFHNKLSVMHKLMQNEGCEKARIMRLIADAPTTTMQRVKGITTGSLPTFIDVSKNFASSEITEDNIIDQFVKSGKRTIFTGDDTWTYLFPNRFSKFYPYPSFDVKDLDLVDDGVIEHLLPEIKEDEFNLLIAHFLGVDHCGHRYGPYHTEMTRKLLQMNAVIEEVINSMSNNTLLLVLGDHGMTATGDHGGETANETNAALFAYSPIGGFKTCSNWMDAQNLVVNQIDLVPTISLLTDTSIPFSNLGMVIDELIPYDNLHLKGEDGKKDLKTVEALYVNAKQVYDYIKAYQDATSSFSPSKIKYFTEKFNALSQSYHENLKTSHKQQDLMQELKDFILNIGKVCREAWAKFNVTNMLIGIDLIILAFYFLFFNTSNTFIESMQKKIMFGTLFSIILSFLLSVISEEISIIFLTISMIATVLSSFVLGLFYFFKHRTNYETTPVIIALTITIFYGVGFTSNSYILNEDITVMYLTMTSICVITIYCLKLGFSMKGNDKIQKNGHELDQKVNGSHSLSSKQNPKKRGKGKSVKNGTKSEDMDYSKLRVILLCTLAISCVRLSLIFRRARPDQFWVLDFQIMDTDKSISEFNEKSNTFSVFLTAIIKWYRSDENRHIRALTSSLSLCLTIWCMLLRIKKDGNLKNQSALNVLSITKLQPLSTLCICIYWILNAAPKSITAILPEWHPILFPCISYGVFIINMSLLIFSPIMLHILYPDGFGGYCEIPVKNKLPINEYYKRLKDGDSDKEKTPIAFGLYTVFTASTLSLMVCMVNFFALLLGPNYTPTLLLWLFVNFAILELTSVFSRLIKFYFVPICSVVLWDLAASWFWFSTGHQSAVASIQWDAAFVGFQGNHANNIIPALLVILNTFSTQIISTISLPLLFLWPVTRGKWYFKEDELPQDNENYSSELMLYKDSGTFYQILIDLLKKHIAFYAIKLLGSTVAALIHRRHLMVWAIFAPNFLFEVLGFFSVVLCSLFVILTVKNTGYKLTKWLELLDSVL